MDIYVDRETSTQALVQAFVDLGMCDCRITADKTLLIEPYAYEFVNRKM